MYAREFSRCRKTFLTGTIISTVLFVLVRVMPKLPEWLGEYAEIIPAWLTDGGTCLTAVQGAFLVWCVLFGCMLGGTVMHSDWEKGLLERYCYMPVTRTETVLSRFVPGLVTACLAALIPALVSGILYIVFGAAFEASIVFPMLGLLLTVCGAYALCFLSGSIFRGRTVNAVACACVFMGMLWLIWQNAMRAGGSQEWIKLLLYDRLNIDKINIAKACVPLIFALISLPADILIWNRRDM